MTRLHSLAIGVAIDYLIEPTPAVSLFEKRQRRVYRSSGAALSNIIERGADEPGLSIQALPGFVLSASIEGQIEYLSPDILRYTGKPAQDVQSDWSACVHPDDVERCRNLWTQLAASSESIEVEIRLRRHDGSYRWFRSAVRSIRDSADRTIRCCAVAWDVEDRVQAQQALEAQAQRLRLIVDTIPGSVWHVGRSGLEYLNGFVTEYTGKRPEELIDPGWQDVLHPDDIEYFRNTWLQTVNEGKPLSIEFRLRRHDGMFRWFRTQGKEIRGDDGSVTGWVGVDIDIDDARRAAEAEAQDALRQSQGRLARAAQLATVGELSASIAHEINQPLTAIAANAQACHSWLSKDPAILDKARATIANIIQDVHGAAVVVKRIRALFKESAPMKTPLNVNELIEEVIHFMHYELERRSIRVELQLQSQPPLTLADRVQIQQVLVNLLQNGADALERSGEQAMILLIRSRAEGADMVVEVLDNGVGFEDAEPLFDAFFTTKADGLGMGLAICRSIIETHAGRIWAAHNDPSGAVFGFALPVMSPIRPAGG
jgi:PAS domain S-box-containing protein